MARPTMVRPTMVRYVAFLRGVNVGGHHRLKMEDLRQAFASWGFQNVKTLLASGNVVFDAQDADSDALAATARKRINETFGMEVSVLVRTLAQIKSLVDTDPFADVAITEQTRLYVTFLPEPSRKVSYEPLGQDFKILSVSAGAACSVLTLTPQSGTIKAMGLLEKEFGRNITTRNWNTISRIAKM